MRYESLTKERPQELVREMLLMRSRHILRNKNPTASIIRDKLKCKFWDEHETGDVN